MYIHCGEFFFFLFNSAALVRGTQVLGHVLEHITSLSLALEVAIAKIELKADPLARSITSFERRKISGQIEETSEISLENDGELKFDPTSLHF